MHFSPNANGFKFDASYLLRPFQVLFCEITLFFSFLSTKSSSRPWLANIFRLMKCLSASSLSDFQLIWLLCMIQSRRDEWPQKTPFYFSVLSMTRFQVHPCPCLISDWDIPFLKNLIHSFIPHSFFTIPFDLISMHRIVLLNPSYILCPLTRITHHQILTE